MKVIGVIPARFNSSRFKGKPLVKLLGKPMIIWVAELSSKVLGKGNVYVATEDERILTVVEEYGYKAIMTSDIHLTGTDRLSEVAQNIDADIYINIQGDEPTVDPRVIQEVINLKIKNPEYIINAMAKLTSNEDPHNVNLPKVITNENSDLIYMSRLGVPGFKNIENKPINYYKQICIYAFSRDQLLKFGNYGRKSKLETHEDIEILRFLDLSIPIKMLEVDGNSYAVDVKGDIKLVENRLKEIHKIL